MGKKEDLIEAFYRGYDRVNAYLEVRLDRLLDFVDRHRYPLVVTFSVHLLLVILVVNLAFKYYDISDARIIAVSMEQLEQIERELEDKPGSDRVSIDARLTHSPQSMSGFTNQAAADLGEDVDISNMRHNFTTLEEARAVTHQTNEYGQETATRPKAPYKLRMWARATYPTVSKAGCPATTSNRFRCPSTRSMWAAWS